MEFSSLAKQIETGLNVDRRDPNQQADRRIGRVVSCNGSRATLACEAPANTAKTHNWSIGSLISVTTPASRVVGFVYEIQAAGKTWREGVPNDVFVDVELVGEITDLADGGLAFQRGIQTYPHLGAEAHRIRVSDLAAIYDLGERKGAEIGKLTQDENIPAAVNIEDMLKRHFAVVGTTGVGKSNAVSILVRKAIEARPNLRVLILDPHNEFAMPFRGVAAVLDTSTFELPFWLFRFEEFSDVVFKGRKPPEGEYDFLREAIVEAKAMYNAGRAVAAPSTILKRGFREEPDASSADTPVPFRMTDIFSLIDQAAGKLDPKFKRSDLRSLKARLESLTNDPRFTFLFGKASIEDSIEPVMSQIFRIPDRGMRITILQLAGIPSEVINSAVSVLARMSFDIAMMSAGRCEVLLLCEEAHRYVPMDASQGFAPTRTAIARIAKEGRKYGCYLGIVTQRPGELDPTILSQCSTVFAMRLSNEHDQAIIRSAIPDSSAGVLGFLSSIGNREAIAFGEAIATPMRMRFTMLPREARPVTSWFDSAEAMAAQGLDLRSIIGRMRGQSASEYATTMLPQMDGPAPQLPAHHPNTPQANLRQNLQPPAQPSASSTTNWPQSGPRFGR